MIEKEEVLYFLLLLILIIFHILKNDLVLQQSFLKKGKLEYILENIVGGNFFYFYFLMIVKTLNNWILDIIKTKNLKKHTSFSFFQVFINYYHSHMSGIFCTVIVIVQQIYNIRSKRRQRHKFRFHIQITCLIVNAS